MRGLLALQADNVIPAFFEPQVWYSCLVLTVTPSIQI